MRRAFFGVCVTLFAVGLFTEAAPAGEYTVYACRANDSGVNRSWTAGPPSPHLAAYADGCGAAEGGLVARAAVGPEGTAAGPLGAANWRFDAPTGAKISQVSLSGRLYRAAGGRWGVGLLAQGGSYLLGGVSSNALDWKSDGYTAVAAGGTAGVAFGVLCASGTGCPTTSTGDPAWGYTRARADLYGARVRVSESAAPSMGGIRGSLASGKWVGGRATAGANASDPVGVARQGWAAAGTGSSDAKPCDFTRPSPCPANTSSDFTVDTRALPDGPQRLTLSATDTAGNTATWTGTAYIDNTRPGAPSEPALKGRPASEWRAANPFTLDYDNPARGPGAPLDGHDVQVCPVDEDGSLDPSACTLDDLAGAPGIDTVTLPRAGRYRARVRVSDALYTGDWSPWSDTLRFDDQVPSAPEAAFPSRWINKLSADGSVLLAAAGGARHQLSGISAYLVAGAGRTPDLRLDANSRGEALLPYSFLREGVNEVAVRALSGAGLATPAPAAAHATLRKDTLSPSLSLAGAPPRGSVVASIVRLEATATDSISGMNPSPPGRPTADGGFISFLSPGGEPDIFRGGLARLSPGEGHQLISASATDVAGNPSVPVLADYTQDTRLPTGGLVPAPNDSPSSLRFLVSETCAGSVAIELSASPGKWARLPTELFDGIARARVPAAIWNRESPYTVRAEVTDCAGNHAVLSRWAAGPLDGDPIGQLRPPARRRTTVSASVAHPARDSRASASSSRILRGRVRDLDGRPARGVKVVFESQAQAAGARWRALGAALTTRSGEASRSVRNAYSQRLRVRVAESDRVAPSLSNVMTTTVRASSSISARPTRLRNGRTVRLSGRLRGGMVPAQLEISLYGRGPKSRAWIPVQSAVPVDRSGRWTARYRFRSTRARTRYRFRVRIPARPDYPFARGFSEARSVIVLP